MRQRLFIAVALGLLLSGCGQVSVVPDAISTGPVQDIVGEVQPSAENNRPEEPKDSDFVFGTNPARPSDTHDGVPSADSASGGDVPSASMWEVLPEVGEITPGDSPMLYDFVNGTLGWHTDIGAGVIKSDVYLLRNLKHPKIIYRDTYTVAGAGLPWESQGILTLSLSDKEYDAISAAMAKVPSERILKEGDWELYLLIESGGSGNGVSDPIEACLMYYDSAGSVPEAAQGEHDKAGRRIDCFGVSISVFNSDPPDEGYDYNRTPYAMGLGYDTEWLRKEPWKTTVYIEQGVDISNSFWDTWTFLRRYPIVSTADSVVSGYIEPVNRNMFRVYSQSIGTLETPIRLSSAELLFALEENSETIIGMMEALQYFESEGISPIIN